MIKDQPYLKWEWLTDSFATAFYFLNDGFVELRKLIKLYLTIGKMEI